MSEQMNIAQPIVKDAATTGPATGDSCRLCGGALSPRFRTRVLGRHDIGYLACAGCGSLQTEPPFWLGEAYASNLSDIDTGAAQRCFTNLGASAAVAGIFGLSNILDIGGGDGLHCRLLRDHGFNAYVHDAHATPTYGRGFAVPDFAVPELVTCFEVLEHFANPAEELASVFGLGAKAVLATTERWHGQGADWWYLAPTTGQHVFFYSDAAIRSIADRFGYRLLTDGHWLLFVQPALASGWKAARARFWLRGRLARLRAAWLQSRNPAGADADFARLLAQKPPA
jgi:hypothetical protein